MCRPYDTCKRDMKVAGIDTTTWEAAADDRGHWRSVVKTGMGRTEDHSGNKCFNAFLCYPRFESCITCFTYIFF